MSQWPNPSLVLPTVGALHVMVGALLLKRGWWPRRVGQTAHCPKCDYILAGAPSRCSECGTSVVARNIVRGERKRRPALALLGGFIAVFGLAVLILVGTAFARLIDWNHHKPLAWLLHDLRSGNASLNASAWDELQRRLDAHILFDTDQARIVDAALQAQRTAALPPRVDKDISAYVADRFLGRKLSAAQADRFFAQIMTITLTVRPVVGSASRVPYWIVVKGRELPGWWQRVSTIEAQVDGGPIEELDASSGGEFDGGSSWGGTLPPVRAPGRHRLRVRIEFVADINRGAGVVWNDNAAFARRAVQDLFADFNVVERQTPIELLTQPDASVLCPRLHVQFRRLSNSSDFGMDVAANALPVDAAFDVLLRSGGKEFPAGHVSFRKGQEGVVWNMVQNLPPDWPAQADVIFRSSEAVARDTPDMTLIWKGEIVLPNVPLARRVTTRPATAPTPGPSSTTTR